jgi:hypothetical protein
MLEFLIDNTFVVFGGRVFQQTVGIPIVINTVHLFSLACSFLQHVDDISFRELVGRKINICAFLAQGICFYVGHSS